MCKSTTERNHCLCLLKSCRFLPGIFSDVLGTLPTCTVSRQEHSLLYRVLQKPSQLIILSFTYLKCQVLLLVKAIFTARKRSLGQGNIFTPVCHSVHRGGSASVHDGIPPPPSRHPPEAGTPPQEQTPPWSRYPPPPEQIMLGDTVNERAVRILLECNLVHN